MRDKLKEYTAKSKEGPENVHIISTDLQQTMRTPKLTCGHAFYLRKILSHNVGIHSCSTDVGYIFTWEESVAKRGSDKIAGYLLKYIRSTDTKTEHLVICSDSCGGKTKITTLLVFTTLLALQVSSEIEHYFLIMKHVYHPIGISLRLRNTKRISPTFIPQTRIDLISK
ncbi:hypothetical protein PR048_017785 [Dryococelus australis]|uniref:Uncharacterized protein n=1 Tax=Dryococelus australis TaxID=614101 RepID=A0ABQ9HAJ4_9NEOP|nr:hypothetical protein PR048_017785 [Dryococelus australis]